MVEGAMMLLPLAVCIIYSEPDWKGFAVAALAALAVALTAEHFTRTCRQPVHSREGFVITALI